MSGKEEGRVGLWVWLITEGEGLNIAKNWLLDIAYLILRIYVSGHLWGSLFGLFIGSRIKGQIPRQVN